MKRIIAVAAVVTVVVILIAASSYRSQPVEAAQVETGDIRRYIDERGQTRLPTTHIITMPFAARVEKIVLEEGAAVRSGQVVARIAPVDIDVAIREAKAGVARLEASIQENRHEDVEKTTRDQTLSFVASMISTVKAAQQRLNSSQHQLEYAEKNLARICSWLNKARERKTMPTWLNCNTTRANPMSAKPTSPGVR